MAAATDAAPAALPGTPHRNNLAYQAILNSSPQTCLEEQMLSSPTKRRRTAQTEYPKQPALAAPGRSQQREKGPLQQGPLDPLISELGTLVEGVKQLAQAIEDIVDKAGQQEKQALRKLFQGIPNYLTGRIYGGQTVERNDVEQPETWAAIASRPDKLDQPSRQGPAKPATAAASPKPREELLQVLVRVPEEHHQWARSLRNFALREATTTALGLSLAQIPDIHSTATGFSIRPINIEVRDKLLASQKELQLCLRATKVELPVKWFNYAIPRCPTRLPNILGNAISTEAAIEDEVIAQTGQRPVRLQPSRHAAQNPNAESKTWIASFLQPVEPFRLFGASALARLIEKRATIQRHNPGCQGFHTNRYCHRQQRCETCSNTLEEDHQQPCQLPPRCSNCYGPFPASHENCPARPIWKDRDIIVPTSKELRAIRRIGQKSYRQAQQTISQNTFGVPDSASSSRRASTSSSRTSISLPEDRMEIGNNTGQQPEQQPDQQPNQQGQRRGRNLPRKNYNITNAYSSLDDEEV